MLFDGLVVVLTAVFFSVEGEQFNCKNGHSFCYWTRSTPSNWTTAFGDCTRSGGSLVYSQYSAYIEEWMSSMNINISNGRVWSSLHRVNHRFQLINDQPAFIPIAASEWIPGHPLLRQWPIKRDCVVVNHRMLYESVDCDSSFAIICAISINRKKELNNLVLPQSDLQVKLVVDPTALEQRIVTNHLEIDRSETNLMLKCKVTYNGPRKLEYSWIKDGVFLGNNQSALLPSTVYDKSKTVSEDAIYQKQGTYQCQVKEFGAVEAFTSNSIIITYRRVLNAVVSISISNSGKNVINVDATMGRIRDLIHQNVLKDQLKLSEFETAWDPLYSLPISPNEIEYRHSLYVDIARPYPDGTLFHIMDVVSETVNTNQQLIHLSGAEKISVKWTTYCPKHNETIAISYTSSEIFHTFWPPSLITPIVLPISEKFLCIQDNNRAESLVRQCLPEFSQGAFLTPLNVTKCNRLTGQLETRCRPGYKWSETTQVCFKVTENGSWSETMSACMNEWPSHDKASVDFATHHSVITQYQETQGKLMQDLWLPVRRSSIYGPLHYYSSVNYGPEGINLPSTVENQFSLFTDEDECMLLTENSKREMVSCSTRAIPGVCVYRPRREIKPVASINLCSPPWQGYIIQNGKLTCFSLFQSESPMNWQEADQKCRHQQHVGMVADVSMATFENTEKVRQWNIGRFFNLSELKSAWIGLFWSDLDRKFCWLNSEKNCEFQHFNWHPSVNWTDGRYGILEEETWNLLPISGTRHQVLCQAVIDLSVTQNIRVHHTPDDIVQVQLTQDTLHYLNPMPHSFANLSEFFSLGWRPWIFGIPPATEVGIQVNCFLDGEMIQRINLFPEEFSLRPNFSAAKILHCEGWVGWPRRLVRSEPIIVLRPDKSFIYLMMFNVSDGYELQIDNQNTSLDFGPDPLSDISKRLEKLGINGVTVQVTGHRWWNYNQTKRILVRAVITSSSANQQNWPELVKDAFLLPEENQLLYQLVYIRSAEACEQETSTNVTQKTSGELLSITWNEVPIGFTSESSSPCETGGGYPILRKCLGNPNTGAVWEPFTEKSLQSYNGSCRPATNLLTKLRKLTADVSTNNLDPSSALGRLSEIAENEFTGSTQNSGIEIGQASRLLHASVQRINQPSMREFNDVSKTLTTMMLTPPNQLEQAQILPGVSNSLIESLEHVMGQVNIPEGQGSVVYHHPKMSTESIRNSLHVVGYGANVAKNSLEIQNGTRILQNEINLVQELVNRDIAIILPVEEIRKREGFRKDASLRLSFSVFANGDLFDARPVTSLFSNENSTYVVDSAIIVAQVGNTMVSNLNQSVRIFFRSRSQHNQSVIPVCVFWDKSSLSGGWSPLGCQYVGRSQDLYICECNHLTPLALLFPYFDKDKTIDYRHRFALSLISVVGCVASMVGLSLVILTFLLFRKWRKSLGNKILFNFSLALFCVTGCFLCAGLMTFDHRMCKATAASMHYFLLTSFAWMVVEGIYQYLNYVIVIGAQNYKSCFMRRASPVAWGLPILPVLGIFIYDPDLYAIGEEFCWLKLEAFYYTVLTPISIMLLFNISIFIGVLKNVLCLRMRSNLRTSQSYQTRSWYQFRMAVCIFFLLGLAWIFGFVSIGDTRLVFAYLFCIFNSLQGFAIFVFFVLRERNARKLWFEFTRMCGDQLLISNSKTPPTSRSSDYVLKPISRY